MGNRAFIASCCLVSAAASLANAGFVQPASYAMPNGNTGSYTYWDESYTGTGSTTTDNAELSGGLGDLTDGVITDQNWFVAEQPAGPGPYVGWTLDPTIVFSFNTPLQFTMVSVHVDDSNGNGGVSLPQSVLVKIGDFSYESLVPASLPGFVPQWIDVAIPTDALETDEISVTLLRSNSWVFADEVRFSSPVVPEPTGMTLFAAVAAMTCLTRRR